MRMKKPIGLLLSLALLLVPATAAFAKPVASHQLAVYWSSRDLGALVTGSIDVTVEAGVSIVDLYVTESSPEPCGDEPTGSRIRIVQYLGPALLTTSVDRQLATIRIAGEVPVQETVISCGAVSSPVSSVVTVDLTGTALDRPVRTRDRDSGTRFIRRAHQFTLVFDGSGFSYVGMVTKSISSA